MGGPSPTLGGAKNGTPARKGLDLGPPEREALREFLTAAAAPRLRVAGVKLVVQTQPDESVCQCSDAGGAPAEN